ncbi:MAG TPA: hydantoinase B/oxoprolinase family protein [Stellaceae bacterium]|nr:hydantoinase B/oxoprolinase family protein [Stellaceae bacterium]
MSGQTTTKLDPVTLEVVRSALPAIATEMAADLHRTSYNMMIYEVRDFCTALLLPDSRLVSQNVGGVSHFVADLGAIIEDAVKRYGVDGFKAEDVIITNHQAVAGQHLNNIVIYMPYFFKGELLMFSMVRAHWIDIGGMSTGFGAGAEVIDPWQEGLQLDQLKIYEEGKVNEVLLRVIRDNIRFPDSSLGDMRAQMAACRLAHRRLDELFEKFGKETMLEAIEHIFKETEMKCRRTVGQFPSGVYEAESFLDNDGVSKEPVRIHAKVTVEQKTGDMTIDLSGCSQARKAGINSRTLAGARVAYKSLTAPLDPVNEGSFAALKHIIPEGNIMMAQYPAPMAGWSTIIPTVVDTIAKALAQGAKDKIPAAHLGTLGAAVVFFGRNPKTGKAFVVQSIEGGGWGGRPGEDGESASVSVCQGDVRNGSIEAIEMKTPVMIESRGMRTDSGGPGKFRGGLGLDVRVRNFVEGRWNMHAPARIHNPPWGLWGGKPGNSSFYLMKLPGENAFQEKEANRVPTPPETEVVVRSNGGGGWGDPLERDPERVRSDVIEGYVTLAHAKSDYGVVLNAKDFSIDQAATGKLRAERRAGAGD